MQSTWKHEDEEGTLLQIIDFPCDYGDFGGESMWVRVIHGTDNDGVGYIWNTPAFSSLRYGDVIIYGKGTDDVKAQFIGRAYNVFEYAGSSQREYLKECAQATQEVQHFNELAKKGCAGCGEGPQGGPDV